MRHPPLRVWVWTAATLALVVVAALLWAGSDAAATTSTTAPAAGVPEGAPAAAVSPAWSARTVTAAEPGRQTVLEGRVLRAGSTGVHAVDPGTGAEAWRYTRANARLCDWTVAGGTVVAVFRTEQRCDEAVGLAGTTGARRWTRNLDLRPDVALHGTDGAVLAAAPTGLLALDPVTDSVRWRQSAADGCRFTDAAVGGAGAAVLQHCPGTGSWQVRLHELHGGGTRWTRDVPGGTRLVGVTAAVAVAEPQAVRLLAAADGAPVADLPHAPGDRPLDLAEAGEIALVLAAGTLSAVDQVTGEVRWEVPARGLPSAPAAGKAFPGRRAVPVPEPGGFALRDLRTGEELGLATTAAPPAEGRVTVIGAVVVVTGPGRLTAYR